MNQDHELAAILVGIVLAFGFIVAAILIKDITFASYILLAAAVVFGIVSAAAAFILLKHTKPT